jgi:hypothetical protein
MQVKAELEPQFVVRKYAAERRGRGGPRFQASRGYRRTTKSLLPMMGCVRRLSPGRRGRTHRSLGQAGIVGNALSGPDCQPVPMASGLVELTTATAVKGITLIPVATAPIKVTTFVSATVLRVQLAKRARLRCFRRGVDSRTPPSGAGVPFANTELHGLTQLSVWWLRLDTRARGGLRNPQSPPQCFRGQQCWTP